MTTKRSTNLFTRTSDDELRLRTSSAALDKGLYPFLPSQLIHGFHLLSEIKYLCHLRRSNYLAGEGFHGSLVQGFASQSGHTFCDVQQYRCTLRLGFESKIAFAP